MKCPKCRKDMKLKKGSFEEDNISYDYYRCDSCNEEILDMDQMKKVSHSYRKLRDAKKITFSRWGNSLALRIPKELVDELEIKEGKTGLMYKDKDGIRIDC